MVFSYSRGRNKLERLALISEGLAIESFGSAQNALGREVRLGERDYEIAGVATDNRHYGPDQPPVPAVYLPITAVTFPGNAHMAVRVDRPDAGLTTRLREAVWRVEPDLPVPTVRPLDDWAGAALARPRFESLLFSTFGAIALLLVAGGLYGTLLYTVRLRRRAITAALENASSDQG